MVEPWDLRPEDTREVNSRPTFIIFCEDGVIEPEYFKLFASDKIKISTIPNYGQQHKQVDNAAEYFRELNLLEPVSGGKERIKFDEGAQVWCVFDRDKEENDRKDSTFNNSIMVAEALGIKTAWSNDDFELWILLHFEEVPTNDSLYFHRRKYYERLTEILKNIATTEEEQKIVGHKNFSYYDTMKSKKRFLGITFQYMKGKTDIAIKRSQKLELFHSTSTKSNHEKCPCTMVHNLVEEIISKGGKTV